MELPRAQCRGRRYRYVDAMKYVLAVLVVLGIIIASPILLPFLLLKYSIWPMVRDMKKVIDGEMKFW